VVEQVTAYQESGELPSENYEAVSTTIVTAENASTITPSDKLG
jgi:ribose transport system substrate-binding protein